MNLFYREFGSGTPLVVMHGLYGSSDNWLPLARVFEQHFRVILVDLRNHGNSPKTSSHTYGEMVTDLAWLFHELEIEKAHLLGHSMGGKVAMAFAADYPEKTLSLTVADIAPLNYLLSPASELQYAFHEKILKSLLNIDLSAYNERKEVELTMKNDLTETALRKFMLKNLFRNQNKQFEWKINVPILYQELKHIISGVNFTDFEDRIPILNYPVHFIKGSLSRYINNNGIDAIRKIYPEAKLSVIENASHLLHAEKPEEFATIALDFMLAIKS
jgi:esterase